MGYLGSILRNRVAESDRSPSMALAYPGTSPNVRNLGKRGFIQEHADEPAVVVKSQYQRHLRGWDY